MNWKAIFHGIGAAVIAGGGVLLAGGNLKAAGSAAATTVLGLMRSSPLEQKLKPGPVPTTPGAAITDILQESAGPITKAK